MTRARVLIVEDEAVIRLGLEERLEALGHEVVGTAETGAAAIALAEQLRPEIVLMDVRLRDEMDGITAAEIIQRRFAIPAIFLTAFADEETVTRATATEPLGYLHKPVQDRELRTAIEIGLYRYRTERALREREHRYATTVNAITDAVLVTDAEGEVLLLNPAAESLTGWTNAEAKGLAIEEITPLFRTDTQTRLDHPARAVLGGEGPPIGAPTVLLTRDGREIPVEVLASGICPVAGERPAGAVLTVRNVTQRERTEREVRQLERRNAVAAMAAGTAHEFANVLTPIMGFGALLREVVGSNPKLRGMVAHIEDAVARGNGLIQQLQATAGMRHPQSSLEAMTALSRAVEELAPRIAGSIKLEFDRNSGPVMITADAESITRLVRILVTNAAEAIEAPGRIVVAAAVETRTSHQLVGFRGFEYPREGSYLCVTIADTGRGVSASNCTRLFTPFFSTKGYGRGLGLVAAEGIVSAHRGVIRVDSSLDRGTRVTVLLPVAAGKQ